MEMKRFKVFVSGVLIVFGLLLYCGAAVAQEKTDEQEVIDLGEVVITATKSEKAIKDAPQSVSVIKGEDIEDSPMLTIDEMFRYTPSLQIIRGEGIGTTHNFTNIRGIGDKRNLLFVDGVNLVESMSGNTTLSLLPTENIERIEIVRGPSSALYGGRGMAGVINIITKKPDQGWNVSFEPTYGNYDYQKYALGTSYGAETFGFDFNFTDTETGNYWARDDVIWREATYVPGTGLTYSYTDHWPSDDGEAAHEGWENWNRHYDEWTARSKFYYYPSDNTDLNLSIGFMDNETGNAYTDRYEVNGSAVAKNLDKNKLTLGLDGETVLSSDSSLSYRLSYHHHESEITGENMDLTGIDPTADPSSYTGLADHPISCELNPFSGRYSCDIPFQRSVSNQESDDYELELKWTKSISSEKRGDHTITLGTEYVKNDVSWDIKNATSSVALTTPVDNSADTFSLYIQDEFFVNGKFTLTTGLRGDFYDDFNDQLSPKLSALYDATERTQFLFSAGYAFNPPPYSQKYGTAWNMTGYNIRTNNPELDPEKLKSVELGVRRDVSDSFDFTATVYYTKAEDLIESYKPTDDFQIGGNNLGAACGGYNPANGCTAPGITYEYHDNVDSAIMKGLETDWNYVLSDKHQFSGGLTFMNNRMQRSVRQDGTVQPNERLERSPTKLGYLSYSYNDKWNDKEVWTTLRGRGQNKFYLGEFSADDPRFVGGFFVVDFSFGVKFGERGKLFMEVTNMFDKDYREFTYTRWQPGRMITFGGQISF